MSVYRTTYTTECTLTRCLVGHPGTKLFPDLFVDVVDIYSASEYGVIGVMR